MTDLMPAMLALALTLAASGCGELDEPMDDGIAEAADEHPDGAEGSGDGLLIVGDSMFDYNRGEGSIGEVIGHTLGRDVRDEAVGGALFAGGDEAIPAQYVDGDWSWVVMDGGGNDMGACGCDADACAAALDRLVSADGTTGLMPAFVARLADRGVGVMVMGYYEIPPGGDMYACLEVVTTLVERQRRMAEVYPGVEFFDARAVIDPADLGNFDGDRLHPSPQASAALGRAIADAIIEAEGR